MTGRRRVISITVLLWCTACLHPNPATTPGGSYTSFTLVVEGQDGQMLGYEEFKENLGRFVRTRVRSDGATIVTRIKDLAMLGVLESSVNKILASHNLLPIELRSLVRKRHVSCHVGMLHPPARGGGFAGPGLLECADALLVGLSPLSDDFIWKQRGLLIENDPAIPTDPKYAHLIILNPVPPASRRMAIPPSTLTWEQAAPFFRAIPKAESNSSGDVGGGNGFYLCASGNGLDPEVHRQPVLFMAAYRALSRFMNEAEEENARLIRDRLGPSGFAVEQLDPEVQQHLLQLMKEELVRQ